MAIAISAWLDAHAEGAVRDVWRRMAAAGIDRSLDQGPFRPHLTLGVWHGPSSGTVTAALTAALAGERRREIRFEMVGVFVAPEPAVFLGPTSCPALRALHATVRAAVAALAGEPVARCLPDRWNPHRTVAWGLSRAALPAAVGVVIDAAVLLLTAVVDRVGVIVTPDETEVASVALGVSPSSPAAAS
jgi:2'-5' RNA ligase